MLKRTVSKLPTLIVLAMITLMSFSAMAFAQGAAVPDNASIWDLAKPALDAFSGGHYAYAAALFIVFLCAVIKGFVPKYFPNAKFTKLIHTDAGGSALALVTAMAMAVAAAFALPGAHLTLSLVKTSFLVGVGAAGGYAVLKNLLVEPVLKPLAAKSPAWAQPIFTLVFWFFDHKMDAAANAAAVEAKAQSAGAAAVAAKPATGIAGVVGAPTEIK